MSYFFDDADTLVNYLLTKEQLSPLKLQKALYFLYAYYGASYGSVEKNDVKGEFGKIFPEELFPGCFIATNYGPSQETVTQKYRSDKYNATHLMEDKYDSDVLKYLEELTIQLLEASDFSLVERSCRDISFRVAYPDGTMNNEEIVNEYKKIIFPDRT